MHDRGGHEGWIDRLARSGGRIRIISKFPSYYMKEGGNFYFVASIINYTYDEAALVQVPRRGERLHVAPEHHGGQDGCHTERCGGPRNVVPHRPFCSGLGPAVRVRVGRLRKGAVGAVRS